MLQTSRSRQAGFTLTEMMITIGLISIVAGIAIPGFIKWLPDFRLKSAARDLYSNMQWARVSAINNNTDWAIVFDAGGGRYLVCSNSGADGSWSGLADNTVERTVSFTQEEYKNQVAYGHGNATTNATAGGGSFPDDEVSFNSNVATFNSRGMGAAGYAYLENQNEYTFAVGKTSTGSIRCVKWINGNWE